MQCLCERALTAVLPMAEGCCTMSERMGKVICTMSAYTRREDRMGKTLKMMLVAWIASSTGLAAAFAASPKDFWRQWRGPNGSGVAPQGTPPTEWSEGRNVRWKCKLPGEGASSPIVWGDRVYIQAAIPTSRPAGGGATEPAHPLTSEPAREKGDSSGNRSGGMRGGQPSQARKTSYAFTVLAFERKTGRRVWDRVVREETPHEGHHPDGTFSSGSPATDGEHIFAYFGSRGLYCLTMRGEVVWKKDFGDMQTRNGFGEGSSPALHGDTIVVNWDHEGGSFIVALDKRSGEEKWRQSRDEGTSWSTPLVITDSNPVQVVTSATKKVRSYDLSSGKVLWECGGLGAGCVATPVAGAGIVFAMSGRDPALLAIRYAGASGDVTGSDSVVWHLDAGTPYVPSPLLYGDALYFAQKNDGFLSCYNAQTGKPYYSRERLEEIKGIYPSPVGADGRVYVLGRNGVAYVLKHGPKFQVLAVNRLEDRFTASPAVAGGEIYLRGHGHLYCIAAD
jgi:outer membrane protein assembly factor BamB